MLKWAGIALAIALTPVSGFGATATHTTTVSQPQTLESLFASFDRQIKAEQWDDANTSLLAITAHPQFGQLPAEVQLVCYRLLALIQLDADSLDASYSTLLKAGTLPSEVLDADYWRLRASVAARLKKKADAVSAMTALASRFPQELHTMDRGFIASMVRLGDEIEDGKAAKRKLLEALRAAVYTPQDSANSAEWLLFDLFEIYVADKATEKATDLAAELIEPESLIRLRVDKRYGAFRKVTDADIATAFEAQLARHRAFALSHPRLLAGPTVLAIDLDNLARSEEGLNLIDDALTRIAAAPKDKPSYDDLADQHNWALDTKYRLLANLGRYAEAEQALKDGRDIALAAGDDTVSQKINLGGFFNVLGRPSDALNEVADIKPEQASLYGQMSAEEVRACAYAQTGETTKLKTSLELMLKNAKAAYAPLETALLCAGDSERLAKVIIARLEDPDTRADALVNIQTYLPDGHPTPLQIARETIRKKTLSRADVQATIAKYGEIISLPVRVYPY
jgi:tetratricopeptide (TPR) repeat protein